MIEEPGTFLASRRQVRAGGAPLSGVRAVLLHQGETSEAENRRRRVPLHPPPTPGPRPRPRCGGGPTWTGAAPSRPPPLRAGDPVDLRHKGSRGHLTPPAERQQAPEGRREWAWGPPRAQTRRRTHGASPPRLERELEVSGGARVSEGRVLEPDCRDGGLPVTRERRTDGVPDPSGATSRVDPFRTDASPTFLRVRRGGLSPLA